MYPPQQPPPGYPGYPPYNPYGQMPYPYMPPVPLAPQRSGAPRVLGVLAIIFSVIGVGMSLVWGFGPLSDIHGVDHGSDLHAVSMWLYAWMALSGVLFFVELIGGILAVQYKRSGLKILSAYAIAAIALAIVDVVLVMALVPGHYNHSGEIEDIWFSVVTMHIVFSVIALPWPIVTVALANSARAKEACGESTQKAADVF